MNQNDRGLRRPAEEGQVSAYPIGPRFNRDRTHLRPLTWLAASERFPQHTRPGRC